MVFQLGSFPNALNDYGDSYYYIKRQLGFIVISSVGMIAAAIVGVPLDTASDNPAIYVVALILLVAVLFTGYGSSSEMAKRWLEIPGLIRFQPSS